MDKKLLQATFKVLFDGQAFLYAEMHRVTDMPDLDDEMFTAMMDEYKLEAAELINTLLEVDEEEEDDQDTAGGPLTR